MTSAEITTVIKSQQLQFFSQIRRILNKNSYMFTNFTESTIDQDMFECFDAVFSFPDVKIPIRIRNYSYQKYLDFTIRSRTRYGNKTEIDKLKEGFGDYYFYCWLNESNVRIERYMIIDLNAFRKDVIHTPDSEMSNTDGSGFVTFKLYRIIQTSVMIFEYLR